MSDDKMKKEHEKIRENVDAIIGAIQAGYAPRVRNDVAEHIKSVDPELWGKLDDAGCLAGQGGGPSLTDDSKNKRKDLLSKALLNPVTSGNYDEAPNHWFITINLKDIYTGGEDPTFPESCTTIGYWNTEGAKRTVKGALKKAELPDDHQNTSITYEPTKGGNFTIKVTFTNKPPRPLKKKKKKEEPVKKAEELPPEAGEGSEE